MLKGKLVIFLVVVLVVSMALLGVLDSRASVADASAPDAEVSGEEVAGSEAEAEDSPASSSATITITMHT